MIEYEKCHSGDDYLCPIVARNLNYHPCLHRSFEYVYCMEGEIRAIIGNKPVILHSGEGAFIPPSVIHNYQTEGSSLIYAVIFGKNKVPELSSIFAGKLPVKYAFCFDSMLSRLIRDYFEGSSTVFSGLALLYRTSDIFLKNNDTVLRDSASEEFPEKLLDYLQNHFSESISLMDFASFSKYSYAYASKLTNRYMNVSFSQLLSQYRLEYAEHLLKSGSKPISEIALESGFGSIRTFNREFQRHIGMTPVEYRNH